MIGPANLNDACTAFQAAADLCLICDGGHDDQCCIRAGLIAALPYLAAAVRADERACTLREAAAEISDLRGVFCDEQPLFSDAGQRALLVVVGYLEARAKAPYPADALRASLQAAVSAGTPDPVSGRSVALSGPQEHSDPTVTRHDHDRDLADALRGAAWLSAGHRDPDLADALHTAEDGGTAVTAHDAYYHPGRHCTPNVIGQCTDRAAADTSRED